jgi:hypothetical protein
MYGCMYVHRTYVYTYVRKYVRIYVCIYVYNRPLRLAGGLGPTTLPVQN